MFLLGRLFSDNTDFLSIELWLDPNTDFCFHLFVCENTHTHYSWHLSSVLDNDDIKEYLKKDKSLRQSFHLSQNKW